MNKKIRGKIALQALISALLAMLFLMGPAQAFEAFVIKDIRVEGLERMSAGTVFNYLSIDVGDRLDEKKSADIIRALFATGSFEDVRLRREGNILVVIVRERQAVGSIKISGNEDIDTEELLESLQQIGLAEGRVFDRSLLEKVEQELRRQYFSNGKYGVQVTTTVTPLERNRVEMGIDLVEGKVAKIRQINVVGNQVFEDEELLDQFQLTTPKLFSFFTKSDQYAKQKLAGDLEVLRSYYLDQGYIDFNINSTQVSITPDKRDIYITINISEGKQHYIEEVRLAGELILPAEELFPLVLVNPGDLFSRKKVTSTVERISKRLGAEGYAFANVNAIPKVDKESKQVTLTFFVDPGKRVYVRRVNMEGNTRTRDEVLRREMRQMEGGWFAGDKVERSRTRLNRLGYFEEVNVETPAVPGTTDQVDVNFSVTERPSGSLLFGLGFSQTSGLLVNASVNQTNFLGSGNRVNLTFNNSQVNTNYAFSFLNPYHTIDGVSRGFGLFLRQTDAGQANLAEYTTDTYGGNLNYGIPLNEFDTVRLRLEYENLELKTTSFSSKVVTDFIAANGDRYDTFRLVGSLSHDTRNRAIFADRGMLQRVSVEVTVPGLDLDYFKLNYKNLIYIPLTQKLTMSFNLELGYGDGYNDLDELPFFKNFFAGGVRSVRGFQDNTLGPRDERNNPLGGALKTVGNVEIIFPPPFMPDSNSLRMSGFFDIGNVFENVDEFDANELRYSVGIATTWLSPFGALTFSVAKPLNEETIDSTQAFQFTFGGQF